MLSLSDLAALAAEHPTDTELSVEPLLIGSRAYDVAKRPVVMGCVNLSRDSTYRESIAVSTDDAVRKARVMSALGADIVDIGAESSTARASRVSAKEQIASLVPVIERLTEDGIAVSAETYDSGVARACAAAGARVLNLTGRSDQEAVFEIAAEFEATVVLCYVAGANVREITDVSIEDPFPGMITHFEERLQVARAHGVDRLVIDPGMGFYYGNLVDPSVRARHQTMVLLNTFRLRSLGLPICNAMPHAFDLFGDQFRTAEGFFSVLAALGGTNIFRTHEVGNVRVVLDAMASLSPGGKPQPWE